MPPPSSAMNAYDPVGSKPSAYPLTFVAYGELGSGLRLPVVESISYPFTSCDDSLAEYRNRPDGWTDTSFGKTPAANGDPGTGDRAPVSELIQ